MAEMVTVPSVSLPNVSPVKLRTTLVLRFIASRLSRGMEPGSKNIRTESLMGRRGRRIHIF